MSDHHSLKKNIKTKILKNRAQINKTYHSIKVSGITGQIPLVLLLKYMPSLQKPFITETILQLSGQFLLRIQKYTLASQSFPKLFQIPN